MKVLYFHQYFSTRAGGTGTRSYEMAKALVQAGHEVTMICASYGPANTGLEQPFKFGAREGIVDGIEVVEFELPCSNSDGILKRTWTFLKYSFKSTWAALTKPTDLVFATSTPLTAAIPGLACRWIRRKPFVFEVRDLWPELPKAMGVIKNPLILFAMAVLEKRAYRASTRCIGLAPGIAEGISRHIPESRVDMIPNGCDMDLQSVAQANLWRPAGVLNDDFMAVFTGTHGPANGLDALIDVARELNKRRRGDIKLVLVGDGKDKPRLKARAEAEDLKNIVFHDRVNKEKIAGLLGSANLGMQILANVPAFYFGTSPNKFFDYLSVGLPVLNNYPGWVAKLLETHKCGVAVEPENPKVFADAIIELADNPERCKRMGKAARALAESEFSRPRLADAFVQCLEQAQRR